MKRAAYRIGLRRARRLPCAVVSVGNLVAGGTGKTPFVIALAQALRERGRHPGILARGYRRAPGMHLNDEGLEIERALGDAVPQVQDPDRVRGGRRLLDAHPDVDVLLLDDGFQHWRLHRDVDIVLVDATAPFGFEHLLPRGLLRERPAALARAHLVALTRCEQADAEALDALTHRIGSLSSAPVTRVRTEVRTVRLPDREAGPEVLSGARIHAVAGVGRPEAVRHTLEALGATVSSFRALPDHAAPSAQDWQTWVDAARADGAAHLVITGKDAVKLPALLPGMAVLEVVSMLEPALVEAVVGALGQR